MKNRIYLHFHGHENNANSEIHEFEIKKRFRIKKLKIKNYKLQILLFSLQMDINSNQVDLNEGVEELLCPICQFFAQKPKITNCGHIICDRCYHRWLETSATECHVCRSPNVTHWNAPRIIRNMIEAARISCPNASWGCESRLAIKDYEIHTTECGFEPVTCDRDGCTQVFLRMQGATHVQYECAASIGNIKYEFSCFRCKFLIRCNLQPSHCNFDDHFPFATVQGGFKNEYPFIFAIKLVS